MTVGDGQVKFVVRSSRYNGILVRNMINSIFVRECDVSIDALECFLSVRGSIKPPNGLFIAKCEFSSKMIRGWAKL